jgi:hypothetical protein
VSSGSGPHLPTKLGSDVTTCPMVPYEPWALSIKKSLTDLPTQPGSSVPNARTHVPNVAGVSAIMCLQDVRIGGTVKTYNTCGQVATVLC